jgi:hypothetical protein
MTGVTMIVQTRYHKNMLMTLHDSTSAMAACELIIPHSRI